MSLKHQQDTETVVEIKAPRRYQVIMHNDDFSTWEFVIEVLKIVFRKDEATAVDITSKIHHEGFGICGEYSYEIAEMKVSQVHNMAKSSGYPLKCTIEEA